MMKAMMKAIALSALLAACATDVECPICERPSETQPHYTVVPCGRAPTYQAFEDILIDGRTSTVRVSIGSWNAHMGWAARADAWARCIERLRATHE